MMQALAKVTVRLFCLAAPLLLLSNAVAAQSNRGVVNSAVLEDSVPAIVSQGSDVGPVAPEKEMQVTVWLKGRKSAAFDQAVEQLYTPGSPTYHQWMSSAELARYAATPAEIKIVKAELEAHGLSVENDGSGMALVARGQAGQMESAFHTQLRTFALNGRLQQVNATKAALAGTAGTLVEAVSGLAESKKQPKLVARKDLVTGLTVAARPLTEAAATGGFSSFITTKCFQSPLAFQFTTPGASLPVALYFGNIYDQGPSLYCGYDVKPLAAIYGVDAAAKLGLTGAGQTIVIVDAFGSPTITADANLFSSIEGLPALTSANFQIVYPGGNPVVDLKSKDQQGWAQEVALDVEWAHAMAPQAKIVLVAALSDNDSDIQYAVHYATVNHLGDVMSNSYGGPESNSQTPVSDVKAYNTLVKRAAAAGIAFNASSGDAGDQVSDVGVVTVSSPADSPYATSVGGTSLNVPAGSGLATTGWGTTVTELANAKGVYDPPKFYGFQGGGGGGESSVFNKPAYQKGLPGSGRQQPDVSAVADPNTGVPVIYTDFASGLKYVGIFGGTSVASPIFSALWALADELAGSSLGQAAPIVAQLTSPALLDVLPVTSAANVSGAIVDGSGFMQYGPSDLVAPLSEPKFVSAIFYGYTGNTPSSYYILSFGTDSSLRVEKGWDNVTGYGTPGGLAFIKEAATYK